MHDDRELLEKRIRRELWERVLPTVEVDHRPLTIESGPDPEHLTGFDVGATWGRPWATTWFRLSGEVPAEWASGPVEAVIDLGFTRAPAGFQAEGLVVEIDDEGVSRPLQGIHPMRTNYALGSEPGPVGLLVEAASNPSFPQFRPSPMGSPATAGDRPLYTFRRADLVLVDADVDSFAKDLEVLDGVMRATPIGDPRRDRMLDAIIAALDRIPDAAAATRALAPHLAPTTPSEHRHVVTATGHAHIDTAWLWPTRETERKCARTFSSAVALMDEYPEYRFSCSQAQQYAWIERNHPELFARIVERVERGQWLPVGGMWVEADMNLPSGESLVRQIVFGQRYFEERFGRRCDEVWIPDVFGYPAGLPQVFAAGGMTRFVTQKLSWNKQNRFPHHTFWWEGLDGTRILTHFPPVDTYNAEITPEEVAGSIERFREHRWSSASLMPFGYGDGGGGPTREMLERARRLADIDPAVRLEIGAPADFFRRVEREATYGADVPVWRGELYFETHRGTLTSQLRTKVGNRRCERLLVEAELWAAALGSSADVDDLWRDVLTQQFHDILPGSSIACVHDDAEAVFARVESELDGRIRKSLRALAPSGRWLANPSDAPIDGVIVIDGPPASPSHDAPTQELSDGSIALRAAVPALGLAPFAARPVDDRVVVTESSMINGRLAIRWDAAGNIYSVIDLERVREIVPPESQLAVLELARDQPVEYDAWDLEAWTRRGSRALSEPMPSDGAVLVEVLDHGPLVGRVRVTRTFGPSTCALVYELCAGARELRVHVDLDWHHDEHLLSIAFPLDVRADIAHCDVQFGVVSRPTHPSSPWDAAKFEVCAHRFVSVAEPNFGVAVLNNGRYGHCVFDGAVRVSLARAARYPDPDADRGEHAVTLALRPHDGDLGTVRAAAATLNGPPRVVEGDGEGDGEGSPASLVEVLDAGGVTAVGVEVDAVKLADDESGDLIIRLHEACGDRTPIVVRAARRIESAARTNLLEDDTAGEEVGDGIVSLTLAPFQIVTLRLTVAAHPDHT
ncbi:MAG: glycoside hydrolase family 38 C-terminal domain-containing protein [Acidimicrobiia bacterium]|nr:glycoside hydrolase family 38 C-terminal domain-containing protein [Acidimicrobiia bacterium]